METKTQIERIEYFKQHLAKVIESHGLESDYTTVAFFHLQAAKMGKTEKSLFDWANNEFKRLHQIALDEL